MHSNMNNSISDIAQKKDCMLNIVETAYYNAVTSVETH